MLFIQLLLVEKLVLNRQTVAVCYMLNFPVVFLENNKRNKIDILSGELLKHFASVRILIYRYYHNICCT